MDIALGCINDTHRFNYGVFNNMKTLYVSFDDAEYKKLKKSKDAIGFTWHDYILLLPKQIFKEGKPKFMEEK